MLPPLGLSRLLSLSLLLFLLAGLASSKIERFEDRKGLHAGHSKLQHVSQEEALKSIPQLARTRRQASDPQRNGRNEFLDGYRHGLIHYSGEQSQVIFVLTYNLNSQRIPTASNLYRSTNYGMSFDNIESSLASDTDDPLLWPVFYVSPVNKNLLVIPSYPNSRIYYTLDEGDNWNTRDFTPSTINPWSLSFSPTRDSWILGHDQINDNLYITVNLGTTWKQVATYVDTLDYQWGEPKWESDDSIIYFNQYDPTDRNRGNFTVGLYTQRFPYGPDTQEEFDSSLGKHDDFLLTGPYIFAQKTNNNDEIYLLVSYQRGAFEEALIPTPFAHQNYIVTHIEEKQALVIIEHKEGFYNLYLSDETGVYYSLSLRDIVVRQAIDLEKIEGVNGTMIANQYVRDDAADTNSPLRTIITLDNGGNWELIHPPDIDISGNPVTCAPPFCSLHFHMDTSEYARLGVFSTDSAPGIIIAHGTLGETLADSPDLYISRDGGVSWYETLSGSFGVNVLDHGGVVVAVNDYHQTPSTTLKYTCNEGLSWQSFTFNSVNTTVLGVITEPGEHTTIVSLYSIETGGSTWVVVTVDFSPIFTGNCADSDYYDWYPWDDRSDTDCILGSSVAIERREISSCCLNGRDYLRETKYEICECTDEDYECDYGYEHPNGDLSGQCVRDPDVELEDPCANQHASTHLASTGYRKIAGDVCRDGVEDLYAPYEASCCEASSQDLTKEVVLGTFLGLSILDALLLCLILTLLLFKYTTLKRRSFQPFEGRQIIRVHSDRDEPELERDEPEPEREESQDEDEDDAPLIP